MKKFSSSLIAMVVAGGLFPLASHAAVESNVFGQTYQPVASVAASQAQVVFYRTAQVAGLDAAHVYVDGEYQSALLAGMYSTFCVPAGNHSLGAFLKDAPYYKGKEVQQNRDTFVGGKTYFVKVDGNSAGRPVLVSPLQAAVELKGLRAQAHTLDRASSVEQCRYTASPTMDYTLSSDVLFAFGKSSRNDITVKGREAVDELVAKLKQDGVHLNRIQVIGHTDPIGKPATNMRLGQQRANTVRTMLAQGGLPARNLSASSTGSEDLVVNDCSGTRAEQIQCNAPNRRVVVRVQTQ